MHAAFDFTQLVTDPASVCNQAAIRESWGTVQGNAEFLRNLGWWPRQATCVKQRAACRVWEITGAAGTCEPALWLDAGRCMSLRLAEDLPPAEGAQGAGNIARGAWVRAWSHHATPEHVSLRDGACTYLPSLSRVVIEATNAVAASLAPILRSLGVLADDELPSHNIASGASG